MFFQAQTNKKKRNLTNTKNNATVVFILKIILSLYKTPSLFILEQNTTKCKNNRTLCKHKCTYVYIFIYILVFLFNFLPYLITTGSDVFNWLRNAKEGNKVKVKSSNSYVNRFVLTLQMSLKTWQIDTQFVSLEVIGIQKK